MKREPNPLRFACAECGRIVLWTERHTWEDCQKYKIRTNHNGRDRSPQEES